MSSEGIVQVYFNLHKKCWSIRSKAAPRKVLWHVDVISIKEARFVVSEKGRQRVLRERRKNVHAYVEGKIADQTDQANFYDWFRGNAAYAVGYNPYKAETFHAHRLLNDQGTIQYLPISGAEFVHMSVHNQLPSVVAYGIERINHHA